MGWGKSALTTPFYLPLGLALTTIAFLRILGRRHQS